MTCDPNINCSSRVRVTGSSEWYHSIGCHKEEVTSEDTTSGDETADLQYWPAMAVIMGDIERVERRCELVPQLHGVSNGLSNINSINLHTIIHPERSLDLFPAMHDKSRMPCAMLHPAHQ